MNLMPPPNAPMGNGTKGPRSKVVPLSKGKGLLDWVKLANEAKDLAGTGGKLLKVTEQDLAAHGTKESCWLVLNGLVYNVTPYLEFHPGGIDEILRGIGKDATGLFNEVHPWVNYESMLKSCLVGRYVGGTLSTEDPRGAVSPAPSTSKALTLPEMGIRESGAAVLELGHRWAEVTPLAEAPFPSQLRLLLRPKAARALELIWDLPGKMKDNTLRLSSSSGHLRLSFGLQAPTKAEDWTKLRPSSLSHDPQPLFRKLELVNVEHLSQDTRLLRLALPGNGYFTLPVGHHVYLRKNIQGMSMVRPYTPVSASPTAALELVPRQLCLLVKVYPDGVLTPALAKLAKGDEVDVSDPEGSFDASVLEGRRSLVLLAAGTGITPMLRLAQAWKGRESLLVFFNKSEADIPWRSELDGAFGSVTHVLSQAAATWKGRRGRISSELLADVLAPKLDDPYFAVCGPTAFTDLACGLLKERGTESDHIHAFKS